MSDPTSDPAARFIEQMGLVAQGDHLPRIAGRILGLLVLEGGPCGFSELAERLQVSRGSISSNTRVLEDLGVIERVTRPGDRQDYFQMGEEPYARMLGGIIQRMERAQAVVRGARVNLKDATPETQRRLERLGEFYRSVGDCFRELVARFSEEREADAAHAPTPGAARTDPPKADVAGADERARR
jgi:DNA-binding transcriptional regulator GbsR (MarR family)